MTGKSKGSGSRNRNIVIGLIAITLIVGFLGYFGVIDIPFITQAIISQSKDVNFDNGKVYTIVALTIDKTQAVSYLLNSEDYALESGESTLGGSEGDIVRPQNSYTLTFTPSTPTCTYRLESHGEPVIFGVPLNLYYYYTLSSPELSAPIKIKDGKSGTEKTIDGSNIGETTQFGSSLSVQTQGILIGKSFCPSGSGAYILNNGGEPKVVDASAWISLRDRMVADAIFQCGTNVFCLESYLADVKTGRTLSEKTEFSGYFINSEFDDSVIKTSYTGYAKSQYISNPVILLTADQSWFNSIIYSPPKTYKPQIMTYSLGNFNEERQSTFRILVKNTGNAQDIFRYTISTNKGTISPTSAGITINAGDTEAIDFSYSPPSVSADTDYSITFRICSHNQIESECDSKTYTGKISNVDVLQPPPNLYCGDGKCSPSIGETTSTCSRDCGSGTGSDELRCSAIENAYYTEGVCVCNDGFVKKYDESTGTMYCEMESDFLSQYGIWILAGIVILGILGTLWYVEYR